jgi:PAS domain S-box-containing protein
MAQGPQISIPYASEKQAQMTQADPPGLPGMFSWSVHSGEISWSEEIYRIYEYDQSIKPTLDLARRRIHPDDLDLFNQTAHRATHEAQDFGFGHRLLMPNGRVKHVQVLFHAVTNEAGELVKYIGAVLDVTRANNSQKTLEKVLEETQSSREQLRLAIDTIPGLVWTSRPDGHIDFLNRRWLEYTGLALEEASGWGWQAAVHPEDIPGLLDYWGSILAAGKPGETEARLRRHDGAYRWFLFRGVPLYDELGNLVKWFGTNTDIEDRRQAEGLLSGENRVLEMIAKGEALPVILDALCRLVEEMATGSLCSIMLLVADGSRLLLGSAPSLPDSYIEWINWISGIVTVGPKVGPCAMAAHLGEAVIVSDVDSDPRWPDFTTVASANGLRACWSEPILSLEGRVLGSFAVYSREPGSPTPHQKNLLEQFTHIAAVAVERKRAIEQLHAKQELLDLAQKAAHAMAFDWYIKKEVNSWSPEQEALYGIPPGSFDGTFKSWKKLIHFKDWPLVVEALKRARETGEVSAEFRVRWPDGSIHWLAANGQMFFDDEGQSSRMVGFTADVTPRKLVEEELRRSEASLARAQHLSKTGGFSWRVDNEELLLSDETYRICQLDPAIKVTGEIIRYLIHPEDLPLFRQMLAGDGKEFSFDCRLRLSDGYIKYLQVVANALRDDANQLVEWVGAVRDVTEQKLSEDALQKVRVELAHFARVATLGELTASIAHEVNQPLAGIVTNASACLRLLTAEPPNITAALETARRTIRDGNRAAEVIKRLRALFKKQETTIEKLNLNEAIQEIVVLSRSEAQKAGVTVRTKFAVNIPALVGDRVQLQQVVLNLVLNAVEAMSGIEKQPIEIVVSTKLSDDDCVQVAVKDAGVGLDPQTADRIFEAFFSSKSEGMGMGLSISRSIVENHGGRLWAELNDGPGATFLFTVPLHQYSDQSSKSQNVTNMQA